jgi:hypothetical protein
MIMLDMYLVTCGGNKKGYAIKKFELGGPTGDILPDMYLDLSKVTTFLVQYIHWIQYKF